MSAIERRKRLKIAQWRVTEILEKVAAEAGVTVDEARAYAIQHAAEIFTLPQ